MPKIPGTAGPYWFFFYSFDCNEPKSIAHTDTHHGHFEQLIPNERVVERLEFETADPLTHGEMRTITHLAAVSGGTCVTTVHEGLPPGVTPADNEAGWQAGLAGEARGVPGVSALTSACS